jgi:hypothetical protein
MFGRTLAVGLVLVLTCAATGCHGFFFHRCGCRPFLCAPRCGPCEQPAGCGCAAYYPPGGPLPPGLPPGPPPIPLVGAAPMMPPAAGQPGLGYAPMPTAAPPTSQARLPLR